MSVFDYSQLEPEYLRLRAYHMGVRAWMTVAWLTDAEKNAMNSVLNSAAGWLDRLGPDGDLGRGVINGTFEVSRWVAIANAQGAQIQNAWSASADTDTNVWNDIVVPTAQQTAQAVQAAAQATPGILASLAVLAVVYFALKVTR